MGGEQVPRGTARAQKGSGEQKVGRGLGRAVCPCLGPIASAVGFLRSEPVLLVRRRNGRALACVAGGAFKFVVLGGHQQCWRCLAATHGAIAER